MLRALFITDGKSDLPLGGVIESAAARAGFDVEVVGVPNEQIASGGRTVAGRLRVVLSNDNDFDLVIVHRDAEGSSPHCGATKCSKAPRTRTSAALSSRSSRYG